MNEMSSRPIGERIFIGVFVLLAAWIAYFGLKDTLKQTSRARTEFQDLVKNGVRETATVADKREEYVNVQGASENSHYRFYVTLAARHENDAIKNELRFQNGFDPRGEWEKISVGDQVEIFVDPKDPQHFYAPTFLEYGEALAEPQVNFWMYIFLGGALVALLAFLLFNRER